MRRALLVLALSAMLVLAFATVALAKNTGVPPGPPEGSGGRHTNVFHCNSVFGEGAGGTRGVIVTNKNDTHDNNCDIDT